MTQFEDAPRMAISTKVYRFCPQPTKAASPVFDSDVDRKAVIASFHQPRVGQWCADRKSLEKGALVPSALREAYGIKALPHILQNAIGWVAVSETVRSAIETLEPGVHAFTAEIPVTYKDGRAAEHRYFGLGWGADLVGSINVEKSPWYPSGVNPNWVGKPGFPVPFYSAASANKLAINAAVVQGRHLWRAADYGDEWFCSEDLYQAFRKGKIQKLDFFEQGLV
ncbi:MAG: hypothetical protein JNK19_08910 [Tabrizicola sp.]|nr:hypothetical protein [Tabrizicola sp.]